MAVLLFPVKNPPPPTGLPCKLVFRGHIFRDNHGAEVSIGATVDVNDGDYIKAIAKVQAAGGLWITNETNQLPVFLPWPFACNEVYPAPQSTPDAR